MRTCVVEPGVALNIGEHLPPHQVFHPLDADRQLRQVDVWVLSLRRACKHSSHAPLLLHVAMQTAGLLGVDALGVRLERIGPPAAREAECVGLLATFTRDLTAPLAQPEHAEMKCAYLVDAGLDVGVQSVNADESPGVRRRQLAMLIDEL